MIQKLWIAVFAPDKPNFLNNPLIWLLWYIFGNSDDGPYARYGGKGLGVNDRFLPIEWKAAIKWWCRNPFHNFFFCAIDIKITKCYTLIGTPNNPDAPFWNVDTNGTMRGFLFAINGGPFISYRKDPLQFYIGFRPFNMKYGGRHGVFGIALRKKDTAKPN